MKKLITFLMLMVCAVATWAQTVPTLTEDENAPVLYVIGSYNRGGYLTSNGAGQGVTHVDKLKTSYWYFTAAEGNTTGTVAGGVIAHNLDGTCLTSDWKTAEVGNTIYILPNGVNENGLSISKASPIAGSSCMDANNSNTGVGSWTPSANDWQGTTWVFKPTTMEEYEMVVEYHPVSRANTLNGVYMIYNGCYNGTQDRTGFMKSSSGSITHVGAHDRALTYKAITEKLFEVRPVEGVENGYTIKSVSDDCYIGANGSKSATAATIYIQPWETSTHTKSSEIKFCNVYGEGPTVETAGFWTIGASASGNSGNDCWNGNPTSFTCWSNSHPWAFYTVASMSGGVTEEMINVAKAYAQHKVDQNPTTKYGTFTKATMTSVNNLNAGDNFDAYVTAVNGILKNVTETPQNGTFLRIQGTSGKYISSTATSGQVPMTENEKDAVLWYSEAGELIGFQNGLGFKDTHSVAAYNNTKEHHTFQEGSANKLQILSDYSGSKYLYDSDDKVNRNSEPANQTNWTVTDVTSLPIAINAYGFASVNLPVAIQLGDNTTAWYASVVKDDEVTLTKVEDILPANTPAILINKNKVGTTVDFNIATENSESPIADNKFEGTIAAIATPAGKDNYVLSGDGIKKYTGNVLKGFRAYLPVEQSQSIRSMVFEGEDVVTAIEAAEGAVPADGKAYDLNGRSVVRTNGVVIVNGKTIAIK